MKRINRLKIVLVEKEKTSKWLAEQLGNELCKALHKSLRIAVLQTLVLRLFFAK